jgi:adenylosuccinate lyase
MMEAVKAGVGRETAHEAIKEHAVATVHDLRNGKASENNLLQRLEEDERLPLDAGALAQILAKGRDNVGQAKAQIAHFDQEITALKSAYPEAATYSPGSIL